MEEDRPQEETGLQHQDEDDGLFAFIWMVIDGKPRWKAD